MADSTDSPMPIINTIAQKLIEEEFSHHKIVINVNPARLLEIHLELQKGLCQSPNQHKVEMYKKQMEKLITEFNYARNVKDRKSSS